jgi:hypothetical protein
MMIAAHPPAMYNEPIAATNFITAYLSRDDIRQYIREHMPLLQLRQHPYFISRVFFRNPYVQYVLRNRSVIPIEIFTTLVETLFSRFFIQGDMTYMVDAMTLGINPLFAFNMVLPYFLRIINNTLHGRADQTVFDKVTTTRYYLSYTVLTARYNALLAEPVFMKPFAFIPEDEFKKSLSEIFTTFIHIGEVQPDISGIHADFLARFMEQKARTRADIKAAAGPLKRALVEYVYHPDRIWKRSQAISMYSWDYMDSIQ